MIIDSAQQQLIGFFEYIGLDMNVEISELCDFKSIRINVFKDYRKDEQILKIITDKLKESQFQKDCQHENLSKISELEGKIARLKTRIDELVPYENYFNLEKDMRHNIK